MPEQPSEAELEAMQRLISRVVESGKPAAPALFAYAQELPAGKHRGRLERLASQLESGKGQEIDENWLPLLAASTSAEKPGQIPIGIIDELQREGDLRSHFASSLIYPILVSIASLVVLLFISLWIVPIFREMFNDFGLDLPFITEVAIGVAEFTLEFGWVVLVVGFLFVATLFFSPNLRGWFTQRLPIFGLTIRLSDRTKFTRYLADLLTANVPPADALRISGRCTGETRLRREANQFALELESGNVKIHDAVGQRIPHAVLHTLSITAKPENAAAVLRELSWMYDQQTRGRLAWISGFIEPAFIILLGFAIGFFVLALFMPLVSLVSALSG